MRCRKVVCVLVAHKVQRHLRQRALEVAQAWKQPRAPQIGQARGAEHLDGNEKTPSGRLAFSVFCYLFNSFLRFMDKR